MMLDDGVVSICRVTEGQRLDGGMPTQSYAEVYRSCFADRTVGYGRIYAASGAGERIDRLIRVEHHMETRSGMIAIIDGEPDQYRVSVVQHLRDESGLYCTDLTLERVEGEPNAETR